MIIESISITNFRQFYAEVLLECSIDPRRNVTVIHGANGSGKTSLLNAFKWCFYGQTDFDTLNENILNEASIQEQKEGGYIEIKIVVKFLHDNKRYGAIRTQRFRRVKGVVAEPIEDSQFALDVTREDGETKRSRSPFVELQSILPQDLQPYFFFNGERIEHIAGVNQSTQIRDAIRKLMGLELVDRAVDHVTKAKNQYRNQVRDGASIEHRNLYEFVEVLEEDIKSHKKKIEIARREEERAKSEIVLIERELKKYERSRELQERRDELENLILNNDEHLVEIRIRQKRLIDENGFLVLSDNVFNQCAILVEENRNKGILPYGINDQFIDDRIEMGSCICGTKILKGSMEHKNLLEIRKTAGSDELESAYTNVAALLKGHKEIVSHYKRDYTETAKQLSKLIEKNDLIRNDVNEISAQLTQLDDKKITLLEKNHVIETRKRDDAVSDKGIAKNGKDEAERKLEDYNQRLQRLEDHKTRQNIARRRMTKAEEIAKNLSSLRESLSNQVRVDLSERVDAIFQSIIRKPVRAIIDEEYRLQILKKTAAGEEYVVNEQSTGERQVTSLSFISSIIALAKEKHAKKALFFQGGLYPLVMDSPFGALDDDYREKVAASIPLLAEQVIMFVSNSQWEGRVKHACEGKVGKSYKLIYHSPKLGKDMEDEYRVASDNEFDYSTLREVAL